MNLFLRNAMISQMMNPYVEGSYLMRQKNELAKQKINMELLKRKFILGSFLWFLFKASATLFLFEAKYLPRITYLGEGAFRRLDNEVRIFLNFLRILAKYPKRNRYLPKYFLFQD